MVKFEKRNFLRKFIRRFPSFKARQGLGKVGYHQYIRSYVSEKNSGSESEDLNNAEHACSNDHDYKTTESQSSTKNVDFQALYYGCKMDENSAKASILAFMLRYNLAFSAVNNLILLINSFLPTPALKLSQFLFFKSFNEKMDISKHHFCHKCKTYIGENILFPYHCQEVGCGFTIQTSEMYYARIPLKPQFEALFQSNPEILQYCQSIANPNENRIKQGDIYDGKQYHNLSQSSDGKFISLNICTDGVQVLKSAKYSMWPIQIVINELPPKFRFRNIILAGIWYGDEGMPIDSLSSFLVEELNNLSTSGIIISNENNEEIHLKVFPMAYVADSKAKWELQGLKQYNGYYGCTSCYERGYRSKVKNSAKIVFPYSDHPAEMRTEATFLKDLESFAANGYSEVKGLCSVSSLLLLKNFSVIEGFSIDYMHCVLIGVVQNLMALWMSPKNRCRPYSLFGKENDLNCRIFSLKPPLVITRRPQSVHKRRSWKANQWRDWLLYYCSAVLPGILPSPYLDNILLLSRCIWTFLQFKVESQVVYETGEDLKYFVKEYQNLYGVHQMTYNVHQILHLAENVQKFGPLWTTSMFPYETFNKVIKDFVKGYRHSQTQVLRKYSMLKSLQFENLDLGENHHVIDSLLDKYPNLKNVVGKNSTTVGLGKHYNCNIAVDIDGSQHQVKREFSSVLLNGVRICTFDHEENKRYSNSYCITNKNEFVNVIGIYQNVDSEKFYLKVKVLKCQPFVIGNVTMTHIYMVDGMDCIINWIELDNIHNIIVRLSTNFTGCDELVAIIPNNIEMD